MAGTVTLLLAIHNHQPDGNFDEVFAAGYDDCYARILARARGGAARALRAASHRRRCSSGSSATARTTSARMRALVGRGQVEVLGGGVLRADAGGAAGARRARADRDDGRLRRASLRRAPRRACGSPSACGSRACRAVALGGRALHADRRRPLPLRRRGRAARGLLRHREGRHADRDLPDRPEAALRDPVPAEPPRRSRPSSSCGTRTAGATWWSPTATTARSSACGRAPRSGSGTRAGCASSSACSASSARRDRRPPLRRGAAPLAAVGARVPADRLVRGDGRVGAAGGGAGALPRGAPRARGARRAGDRHDRSCAAASGRAFSRSTPRPTSCTRRWCRCRDKVARAPERAPEHSDENALMHARAVSRPVQLLLLARPVRRALPQLPARRGVSPPARRRGLRRRGARRARARLGPGRARR